MQSVWPDTHVDEASLKVHISSLRRTLGDNLRAPEYIATVAGRGYQFIERVLLDQSEILRQPSSDPGDGQAPFYTLPSQPLLIGRESDLERISVALNTSSLLTLVGAGGVGKTSLAITAAHRLRDRFPDGIHFVDLCAAESPSLVPQIILKSLGLRGDPPDLVVFLAGHLRNRRVLMILDNCEHVLSFAAEVTARLVAANVAGSVIVTSREPLGIQAERVVRIEPLASPGDHVIAQTMHRAITYPAVELFVLRTREATGYTLGDEHASTIVELCRLLDGLPLAIEIVAAQLDRFTPESLLVSVKRHLPLTEANTRDSHPRQRTLRATLDWSFGLLSREQAIIFCLLSTFAASFGPKEVTAMAKLVSFDGYQAASALAALLSKSLLTAEIDQEQPRYRLLATTRSYAADRLEQESFADDAHHQHAQVILAALERGESEWGWVDHNVWRSRYTDQVPDIRKALDWCFSEKGNISVGVALTAAAIRVWDELSLISEQRFHVERALHRFSHLTVVPSRASALATAQAWSLTLARKFNAETEHAWTTALNFAERSDDPQQRLAVMFGRAVYLIYAGRYVDTVVSMKQARKIAAATDASAIFDADRMQAIAEFCLGRVQKVQPTLERLSSELSRVAPSKAIRYYMQRFVNVRSTLAFSTWTLGRQEDALAIAEDIVLKTGEQSQWMGRANTLALAGLPLSMWSGQIDTVKRYSALLHADLTQEGLAHWVPLDRFYRAFLRYTDGQRDAASDMKEAATELHCDGFRFQTQVYLGIAAECLLAVGKLTDGAELVDTAARITRQTKGKWYLPELFRMEASVAFAMRDTHRGEQLLQKAHAAAQRMGCVSFQLRIANDMACRSLAVGDPEAAIRVLSALPEASRCRGEKTRDWQRAARLLVSASAQRAEPLPPFTAAQNESA